MIFCMNGDLRGNCVYMNGDLRYALFRKVETSAIVERKNVNCCKNLP